MASPLRIGAAIAAVASALWLAACGGDTDPEPTHRNTQFGTVAGVDQSATSGTW